MGGECHASIRRRASAERDFKAGLVRGAKSQRGAYRCGLIVRAAVYSGILEVDRAQVQSVPVRRAIVMTTSVAATKDERSSLFRAFAAAVRAALIRAGRRIPAS
jgi:hypothetical protein